MRFWKDTSGRYLDSAPCAALLRDGKSGVIDGFTARDGRTYRGHLEIDRDEWKVDVRREGWNERGEQRARPSTRWIRSRSAAARSSEECDGRRVADAVRVRRAGSEEDAQRSEREERAKRKAAGAPRSPAAASCFPRTVCKREITRDEALVLPARRARPSCSTDFTSRFGRPFSAHARAQGERPPRLRVPAARAAAEKAAGAEGERREAEAGARAARPCTGRGRRGDRRGRARRAPQGGSRRAPRNRRARGRTACGEPEVGATPAQHFAKAGRQERVRRQRQLVAPAPAGGDGSHRAGADTRGASPSTHSRSLGADAVRRALGPQRGICPSAHARHHAATTRRGTLTDGRSPLANSVVFAWLFLV